MLEVDVQVVGGLKPVCAEVSRQQSAGVFGDIHARGRAHGGDVLGQVSRRIQFTPACSPCVHGRIMRAASSARRPDPLLEQAFSAADNAGRFLGISFLATLSHKALGWLAGHDHVRLSKGGELAGQIKIALGRGGVVASRQCLASSGAILVSKSASLATASPRRGPPERRRQP